MMDPTRVRPHRSGRPDAHGGPGGVRTAVPRGAALSLVLCLALLGLTACEAGAGGDADGGTAAEASRGGTVVVAGPNDLDAANSLVSSETYAREILRYALFTTLLRYGPELEYRPYLAESWEMLADTGVVFHLRDDVYWHDGRPTTAHDVAFTYRRAKDPETGFLNAAYFEPWGEVEVVDSFTVRFGFEPHAEPLAGWPFTAIMPRHLLGDVPPAELQQAEFNRDPVGNGPFRFVSQRANDRWIFEANPDFPDELGGRPLVDRLIWRVIPESSAQLAELRTGNVDLMLSARAPQLEDWDPDPRIRSVVKPSRNYAFIGWNGQRAPLDDPRVRRALSMGIDRRDLLETLRGGHGELAVGPVPPFHWAYDPSIEPLPYDPDAARDLLVEAGLRDRDGDGMLEDATGADFGFALTVPAGSDANRDLAELMTSDLREVGVDAAMRTTEMTTMLADVQSPERRFDAVLLALTSDFQLKLSDMFHSDALGGPFQLASYSNPEVDDILDQLSGPVDREEARPLFRRLQAIMREEQPWTFLYYYPDLYLMRERVRGVEMDIRGTFVSLPDWSVAEAS